jgi:hypothetical protein
LCRGSGIELHVVKLAAETKMNDLMANTMNAYMPHDSKTVEPKTTALIAFASWPRFLERSDN